MIKIKLKINYPLILKENLSSKLLNTSLKFKNKLTIFVSSNLKDYCKNIMEIMILNEIYKTPIKLIIKSEYEIKASKILKKIIISKFQKKQIK